MKGKNVYTTTYRWELKDEDGALVAYNVQEGLPNAMFEAVQYFAVFTKGDGRKSNVKYHLEIHERN